MKAFRGGTRPNLIGGLFGWIWLLIAVVPIYYIIVTSLRTQADYYVENPLSLPRNPTLAAYIQVFANDFWTYFLNSVIVTVATVAVILVVAFMAAYVIVRSRTAFSSRIFSLFLLGIAIPIQATIVPVYYLIVQLGLYDTLWALILPSVAFAIPISVLILTNFLRDVPRELFESMRVDGATDWQMLWRLAAPMCRPALVTVAIYDASTSGTASSFLWCSPRAPISGYCRSRCGTSRGPSPPTRPPSSPPSCSPPCRSSLPTPSGAGRWWPV
ncbi:carbohydrate ABC transporter permease [Actinomyces ruminis]|uniref:carbohydrate ABC transporter permease n=1 Tax=Actinomyces ruminis TaxID=1937003 RepID=UPI00211DF874|nr:carbohydrate ABC transporter permease [Actinomyces ruminis]